MEIVNDNYLLEKGFTKGFINTHARKMGSLGTRPRLFDKEKLEAYLKSRVKTPEQRFNEKSMKQRLALRIFDEVLAKRRMRAQR